MGIPKGVFSFTKNDSLSEILGLIFFKTSDTSVRVGQFRRKGKLSMCHKGETIFAVFPLAQNLLLGFFRRQHSTRSKKLTALKYIFMVF